MKIETPETIDDASALLLSQIEHLATLGNRGVASAGIMREVQDTLGLLKTYCGLSMEMVEGLAREFESQIVADKAGTEPDRAMELMENLQFNLGRISEDALKAEKMLKSVHFLARGKQPACAPTDLHSLLDAYLNLAPCVLQNPGHSVALRIEKEYDEKIGVLDVVQRDMGQVLMNIFCNSWRALARKAMQRDQSFTPILGIRTRLLAGCVEIAIQDNGTGIAEQDLPNIFDPSFTTRPAGGDSGLGLAVCKRIITAHGGTLLANSRLGAATEVLIRLPHKK